TLEKARSGTARGGYAAEAVCPAVNEGGALVERRLRDGAAASGVQLDKVAIEPGPANEASALTPLHFSLTAVGENAAVVSFLQDLARKAPAVFVDQAAFRPAASVVNLNLKGRVLCWTVARQ
ncbi:MAG TPA: GspMb/PilO family protein, partial [Caulobacteraceae bacterium]|nr:GspMb/PilO family protein [Caulobacteraceae bacterium]